MKRRWWFGIGFVVLLFVVFGNLADVRHLGPPELPSRAQHQSVAIISACEAYRDCPANPERGQYPTNLGQLVQPPFGGSSFLRNGNADLYDPWGNPFQYEVEKNESGETEIRVWTTRTVGKEQKVIGAKRLGNGTVEVFGVER
jgi:hypothetical protein